jgi:superfamily II DNA or RNA helicase
MSNVLIEFDTIAKKPKINLQEHPEIRELFSAEDKAMIFARKRFGRNIPTRKYIITNKGYFELPFYNTLIQGIADKYPHLTISITPELVTALKKVPIADSPIKLSLEPRDYQYESAQLALQESGGMIILPTSAGKTLTIALIVNTITQKLNNKTLILVPNIQLVEQTYKDFIDYGINEKLISRWTGNHDYNPTQIVIANYQILLSEKQDTTVLQDFEALVVDECHKFATAEKISKLIKKIKFKYLYGFTGSLPDNQFDVWLLNKIFGSIIYQKKSFELRQNNYISNVRVVALSLEYKNIPQFSQSSASDPTAEYEEEINWLHTNVFRNNIIVKVLNGLTHNTLILVDRIVHGEHLQDLLSLELTDKQVFLVTGSIELEEREKIRSLMEEQNNVVCIAISKIFSTGISIKNLHNVMFAAIGKAKIKIIQSIGRSLRLHHSKTIATIFDIADTNLKYGFKHFEERADLYKSENIPIILKSIVEK